MSDDALRKLSESLSQAKQTDDDAKAGNERVQQQYAEWVRAVAFPTMRKVAQTLSSNGHNVQVGPAEGRVPKVAIQVGFPGTEVPAFTYSLYLHERTGSERAFVMKRRTVPNRDYGMPGERGEKRVNTEPAPFWNENEGEPFNHAPDITADHIVEDFTKEITSYRGYPWPKPKSPSAQTF